MFGEVGAVRQARERVMLCCISRPLLLLGEMAGGIAEALQHDPRLYGGGNEAGGHERQDDRGERISRPFGFPIDPTGNLAVVGFERHPGIFRPGVRRLAQGEIRQKQASTLLLEVGFVDHVDADQHVRPTRLQQARIDIGQDRECANSGGCAVDCQKMAGPPRGLQRRADRAIVVLIGAEKVGAIAEAAALDLPDLGQDRGEHIAVSIVVVSAPAGAARIHEDRHILRVEDDHDIVTVGFAQENAELTFEEFRVGLDARDGRIGLVPPRHALLLIQDAQDAAVDRVAE